MTLKNWISHLEINKFGVTLHLIGEYIGEYLYNLGIRNSNHDIKDTKIDLTAAAEQCTRS